MKSVLLILAAVLTTAAVALATGTMSVPINFGSYTAGVHNLSDFDTNFAAITSYVNAREVSFNTAANRPSAGVAGRYYYATDTGVYSCDDGSSWRTCGSQAVYTDQLTGLITSTVSQVNQITVAAGSAASDDSTVTSRVLMTLASATQGNTGGTWTVGNFQNKLDAGTLGASQTWHIFVIQRVDTGNVDILYSQSATSPTMPTNYTKKRAIGAFLTNASSALIGYVQNGDEFWLASPVLNVNSAGASVGTTAFTASATVANGVKVQAILNALVDNDTNANVILYLSSLNTNDDAPAQTAAPLGTVSAGTTTNSAYGGQARVWTDTSGQYRVRMTPGGAADVVRIATLGFVYPRRP